MKIIVQPTEEADLLASVEEEAEAEEIYEGIVLRAEYCVDHLCGCSSNC